MHATDGEFHEVDKVNQQEMKIVVRLGIFSV